ncbi:glycosyltransferase [Mitsuokella jalaludinii]|uniref:glycosyltransferase n=1 Tax=Mitsuokella jalaludinii TaxID=187979 RepID=UPI00298CD276|nr:glycosyltransferase [Mitsuokella jalaludinii]
MCEIEKKIAAVVVLYNPDKTVLKNISTYTSSVGKLYIVDNTPDGKIKKSFDISSLSNTEYIQLGENKGIAYALNKGMEMAKRDGFKFLLTMDQDSKFEDGVLEGYLKYAYKLFVENEKIAIIGISHDAYNPKYPEKDWEYAKEIISSGMLISLARSLYIGNFREDFFIDFVDYEYCYRAWRMGYKAAIITKYQLTHQIDGVHPIDFLGIHFNNHNNHNRVRVYYLFRNALIVMKSYPSTIPEWLILYLKIWIKTICVENDKLGKLKYSLYGLYDGMTKKMGKIQHNY